MCLVEVLSVEYLVLGNISDEDLTKDGFSKYEELFECLELFYPDISDDSEITIVRYGTAQP